MVRKEKKIPLTVAEVPSSYPGVVGTFITKHQQRQRKQIKFLIERKKRLGPVSNSEAKPIEYPHMMDLDPKNWKEQDHYAILGFPELRIRTTPAQLKSAQRKLVLKFHPDKCRGAKNISSSKNSDIMTCITHAYEWLSDPVKRRAYDSVDSEFNDDVPSVSKNSKENFFKVFAPVFDRNQRWSDAEDIPYLGDDDSCLSEVDRFYNFWFEFDSWREFSYLDEMDKKTAEDGWDRRQMELENRSKRTAKKKEENKRIRMLVDNAYACDPRIKRFKEEAKREKNASKKARADAIRAESDKKKAVEDEKKAKEEETARVAAEQLKAEKAEAKKRNDKAKKAAKRERQKLQKFCKDNDYFCADPNERITFMTDLEYLCTVFDTMSLSSLNGEIKNVESVTEGHKLICVKIDEMKKKAEDEKAEVLQKANEKKAAVAKGDSNNKVNNSWTPEDLQILLKAYNMFPPGTCQRWETVANWVNTHGCSVKKTSKECLTRAKNLKASDLRLEGTHGAFALFEKTHKQEVDKNQARPHDGEISQRYDAPKPWAPEEQKILEQALKTFSSKTPERWDRIAEQLPGRTKKECMLRFKELADRIKAKRTAAAAAKAAAN